MEFLCFNCLQKVQKGLWKGTHSLSTAWTRKYQEVHVFASCSHTRFTHKHLLWRWGGFASLQGTWLCKKLNILLPRRSWFRLFCSLDFKIINKKIQQSCFRCRKRSTKPHHCTKPQQIPWTVEVVSIWWSGKRGTESLKETRAHLSGSVNTESCHLSLLQHCRILQSAWIWVTGLSTHLGINVHSYRRESGEQNPR